MIKVKCNMCRIVKCINAADSKGFLILNKTYMIPKCILDSDCDDVNVYELNGTPIEHQWKRERFEILNIEGSDTMNKTSNIERHEQLCKDMHELYKRKNKDYGNSVNNTYELYGDIAYAVRITDKMNRVNSLIKNGKAEINDESLNDTIMDLANYCIIWLTDRMVNDNDNTI